MTSIFDCVVVGAGIAGMTSSIYLKRAGLNVLLLEKSAPGGQINMSPGVENYPGFLKIEGATLAMNIFEQVQKLSIEYRYGNVNEINKKNNAFELVTDLEVIKAKSVIIATGRKIEKLNLESEGSLLGKGISYCALCDGNFYKNEIVCIVGYDYKTIEEAIYLSNICKEVKIICEKSELNISNLLNEKLKKISNINVCYNSKVTKLNSINDYLESIDVITNNISTKIICKGLFINNVMIPQLDFKSDIETFENYILVNEKMETNIRGIYACGDIIKKDVYQLTTAVGEATVAAVSVETYLKEI